MKWSDFEKEIAKLLQSAGFDVTLNAKSAKPRQTDLFAEGDEVDLLVEAKDQKRKVDIGDIDALRSRIDRNSNDIVGVIFTTSDLTSGAISGIEADRKREVLAVVGKEIEQLHSGAQNIQTLIDRKRRELRVHGRAWFGTETSREFSGVKFPQSSVEFRIRGKAQAYVESKSGFSVTSYALQIPDSGWGVISGEGARLNIQLTLSTVDDLRNIVGYIHRKFGLTSDGVFSIQQSSVSWHGIGIENFLSVVQGWRKRYRESSAHKFHHSEEIVYFDRFRGGWIEISTQQRVDLDRSPRSPAWYLHNSQLVIQLPGIPVDTSKFLKLCRYSGNDWASFEYIGEKLSFSARLKNKKRLKVIGLIIKKEESTREGRRYDPIAIGVVAKNPFYRARSLPKELSKSENVSMHDLTETELLICDLRNHHDAEDIVDYYELQGVEAIAAGVGCIIRPYGTWNKMLKSARFKA